MDRRVLLTRHISFVDIFRSAHRLSLCHSAHDFDKDALDCDPAGMKRAGRVASCLDRGERDLIAGSRINLKRAVGSVKALPRFGMSFFLERG